LSQGTKDEAARLFRLAADTCAKGVLARADAVAELKALGAVP